ncbi:MAG: hypothetical protein LBM96_02245, partial [Methanobrevibacter sp.]|nr:hypothetical protein [Candidatus Methanoflexus mossambicus]
YNTLNDNYNIIINKNVTIKANGTGAIINGDGQHRLFTIATGLNVKFINIKFFNGKSGNGGALYCESGTLVNIIDCKFINNSATGSGSGGAIYNNYGNSFNVSNSRFENNFAGFGGAIENNGGLGFNVFNSSFVGNSAGAYGYGGAIENYGASNFIVSDSSFFNNFAGSYGGAIENYGGLGFSVFNSSFIGNYAWSGGAIDNNGGLGFYVFNSRFMNNYASKTYGGAIENSGGNNFKLSDSIFVNNSAHSYGGAINNFGGVNFSVFNSSFENNKAKYGGGIFSNAKDTFIFDSNFTRNSQAIGLSTNEYSIYGNRILDNAIGIEYSFVNSVYSIPISKIYANTTVFENNNYSFAISGIDSNYTFFGNGFNGSKLGFIVFANGQGNVLDNVSITGLNNAAVVFDKVSVNDTIINSDLIANKIAITVMGSNSNIKSNNIINNSFGINITGNGGVGVNGLTINFNRFINNTNTIVGAGSNNNLSSNWWGQNTDIGNFIKGSGYILDDYFVMFLRYSPSGDVTITNSEFNDSKGVYVLSFYLALNTSSYDNVLNESAALVPNFNKTIVIDNGTDNIEYLINSDVNNTIFVSKALQIHYNNKKIAIQALGDNENIELKLLLNKPDYTNGLYINGSWTDVNEDGSSWDTPFINLNAALQAIVDNGLNSANCNFLIHIAGADGGSGIYSGFDNVDLTFNSSYSNLTLLGEFNSPIFDGKGNSRIFNFNGSSNVNNISLCNLTLVNAYAGVGAAIYSSINNLNILNCNFNNNNAINGAAIYINEGNNFRIINSSFLNNSANLDGGAIYSFESNFTVINSIFTNNTAGIGGAIYILAFDNFNTFVNISSNNFLNNTNTTIFASNVSNININYNRIYDIDKKHIAVNITNGTVISDVNWNLDYNWWGDNTLDTNFNGINNYFVVQIIKNNLTNYLYTIRLNGSDNDSGFENKLPSFNGDVYLDYSDASGLVVDSNFNGNNSHKLNIKMAQIAIFTLDRWKSEFNNKILINVNNLSGAKYGEIIILNATINAEDKNNTGIKVIFYMNGKIIGFNTTDTLGNAYYHYKIPFTGKFIYEAGNNDSNHFSTNSSPIHGEFIKLKSNIIINSNPNASKYWDNLILNLTLLDEYNNPLGGVDVDFYLNGKLIGSNITGSNGIAIYNYRVGFVGGYNLTVGFIDNENYDGDNASVFGDFVKGDFNITINFNPNGFKYGDNVIFNASIFDEFNDSLSGVIVDFYLNGKLIGSNITGSNGIAIFNYRVGFVGGYNLTVGFVGNENYDGDSASVFGGFVKANSNMAINSNIDGFKYGDRVVINATVLDEYNNPFGGVIVDFYLNGKLIGSNITDSNGIAIFNYVVGFVGGYNLTVGFVGNENYDGDSASVFGEFLKANSNIRVDFYPDGSKYGDRVVFNVTVFDVYGNSLSGFGVDFYLNGKLIGSNITDSNGIAIFNYVVGFVGGYNLTVGFLGNENYDGDSASVFGEFIKARGIINVDNIPKTVDINSKLTIKGNLTDKDGNLLNGKYNLKINVIMGKNTYIYDVKVVGGLWSLKINNPSIGTNNVKINLNDLNYESKKEFKYSVSKIKSIISISAPKIIAGKKTNIVITLKDKNKLIKGKKIIIKSKYLKKPFKATTNSKGQINIRIRCSAIGKFTGTVEFAGDSIYAKSKKTITQIVTGLPDLTFSKIKRIKSYGSKLAVYSVTIKNIGKGDSSKTQLYMQDWKYNGLKSKIIKVNIKAILSGKSLTLTVKFLPDKRSYKDSKYHWFYVNPLKNFKEISYKNNLKNLSP